MLFSCSGEESTGENFSDPLASPTESEISTKGNDYKTLVVEIDQAWVRSNPSDGEVVMKLPKETRAEVIEKGKQETINGTSDYWYKISVGKKSGWIFGSQTSLKKASIVTTYTLPNEIPINVKSNKGNNRLVCLLYTSPSPRD